MFKMESEKINQKPIDLDELLNGRTKIERTEEEIKTDPENEDDFFGPKIEKSPKTDKKTIIIVDYDFGKENENRNSISTLNHRAVYLKNKANEKANIWFLCSKGLYELFLNGVKGKIDHIILGNYEKIGMIDDILKDFKKKGFDEDKIIYQRLRDFREYVRDFSAKTRLDLDINKKRENEVEYSHNEIDLDEPKEDKNKPKIESVRSGGYPVNIIDIDEILEEIEVKEETNPKQIDLVKDVLDSNIIDELINTDKKKPNSHYL